MEHPSRWILVGTLILGLASGLTVATSQAQTKNVLAAKKSAAAPTLDGSMDATWQAAPPMTVKASGGRGLENGSTEVSVRAVYVDDTVYFMMQYKDPTDSFRRAPWQKQADGSWKKLGDPNDKGGDNNLYYEDKWAMHLEHQLAGLRAARVLLGLPHRRGQALREQVHRQRRASSWTCGT